MKYHVQSNIGIVPGTLEGRGTSLMGDERKRCFGERAEKSCSAHVSMRAGRHPPLLFSISIVSPKPAHCQEYRERSVNNHWINGWWTRQNWRWTVEGGIRLAAKIWATSCRMVPFARTTDTWREAGISAGCQVKMSPMQLSIVFCNSWLRFQWEIPLVKAQSVKEGF